MEKERGKFEICVDVANGERKEIGYLMFYRSLDILTVYETKLKGKEEELFGSSFW